MSFLRHPWNSIAETQLAVRLRRRWSPYIENEIVGPLCAIAKAVWELYGQVRGYDLCLMAKDTKLEKRKVYLEEKKGFIAYTILTPGVPEDKAVKGVTELKAPETFDLIELNKIKKDILEATAKKGHTHPPYKERLTAYLRESKDNAVQGLKQAGKIFPAINLIRKGPATRELMKETMKSTLAKGVMPSIVADKLVQPVFLMVPYAGPVAYFVLQAFIIRESVRQLMYAPIFSFAFLKALERDFEHFLAQDVLDVLVKQKKLVEPNAVVKQLIESMKKEMKQVDADYAKICFEAVAFQMAIILLHILKDPKYLQAEPLQKQDFEDRVSKMFVDKKFLAEKIVSALSKVMYKNFDKLNENDRNKLLHYFEYLAEEIVKIFSEIFENDGAKLSEMILTRVKLPRAKSATYMQTLPTLKFHAQFQYTKDDLKGLPTKVAKIKVEVARSKDIAEQYVLTPVDDVLYWRTKTFLSMLYSQGPHKLEEGGRYLWGLLFSLSRRSDSAKLHFVSDKLHFLTENLFFTVPLRSFDALLTGMSLTDKKFNYLGFGRNQRNETLQHNKAFCWGFGGAMMLTAEVAKMSMVWMFGVNPLFLSAGLNHPLFQLFSAASVLRDQPLPCNQGGWDILAPARVESEFYLKQIAKKLIPVLRVKENRDTIMRFWHGENMRRIKIIIGGGKLRSFDTIVNIPAIHLALTLNGRDIVDGVRTFEIYRKSTQLMMIKVLLSMIGYVGPAQVAHTAEGIQLAKSPEVLNQIKLLEHLVLMAERQGMPSFADNARIIGRGLEDEIRELEEFESTIQNPNENHFELKVPMDKANQDLGKQIADDLKKLEALPKLPAPIEPPTDDKALEEFLRKSLQASQSQQEQQPADSKRSSQPRPKSPLRVHSAIQVPAASRSQAPQSLLETQPALR
jgi:hypothetical protein